MLSSVSASGLAVIQLANPASSIRALLAKAMEAGSRVEVRGGAGHDIAVLATLVWFDAGEGGGENPEVLELIVDGSDGPGWGAICAAERAPA